VSLAAAETLVAIMGGYLAIGALVGLVTVTFGAARFDPSARGMPVQARLVILPGAMLLWPVLLARLLGPAEPPAGRGL